MNDLSPSAPKPAAEGLNKAEKAAIVVRFLLGEGAELRLSEMPETLQTRLAYQMGNMRYIDRRTLAEVVTEFARELEGIGLAFPKDLTGSIAALDGKISPLTAARLRKEAGIRQTGDPWTRIAGIDIEALEEIVKRESTEVSAVLLSKLSVPVAAELLGRLTGDVARRIALAVNRTAAVTPDAVERIGVSLATQLDDNPLKAFDRSPEARLGAILNLSRSQKREELLNGLEAEDQEFVRDVRKNIFTFADIPDRLAPRDVPAVLREASRDDLLRALLAATGDANEPTRNHLMGNISKRMAEGIEEDISELAELSVEDGETAMNAVVSTIQGLAESGQIELMQPTSIG